MFQPLGRDTNTTVMHRAAEPQHLVVQCLPGAVHADAAGFGEFQCVADQVDQDLPNSRRIALYLQLFQASLGFQY